MESIAINVDNVSKIYRLYNKPSDRLKEALGFSKKKLYQEHYALNNVSFEVRKGETVGIIGTNGSGPCYRKYIVFAFIASATYQYGRQRINQSSGLPVLLHLFIHFICYELRVTSDIV